MATKTKKVQRPYTNDVFSITGTASFPFLAKTAKDEPGKFAEDKHKLTVSINQAEFLESACAKECQRFVSEWFPVKTDLIDGMGGIKDLNVDLKEDDKFYKYKKDKYQITAKRNPNARKNAGKPKPDCYNEKGDLMDDEQDILRVENGAKVCMIVRPNCYGDYDDYVEYHSGLDACGDDIDKIKAYLAKNDKPIFGVTLELYAVQLLEARKGGAPSVDSINSHIQGQTSVSVDDMDDEPDEEVAEEAAAEEPKESEVKEDVNL